MLSEPVTIINKFGLHTRAAAKLVALASQFESQIEFNYNQQTANCKSIMSLILLGANKGAALELIISGADEHKARDAIINLIQARFDEKE
ncbi:phosphocarrier protein HPr [Gammaproteobacteria bacterium SCGC AG-212-F23]|nr:phosphocarrier protein HPr [Gammaproteobacteria bacterium SCGC AG-212-F23]